MRNLAKLTLFFSLSFFIIFLAAAGLKFLSLQVDWEKNLPPRPEDSLTIFISAAHWALSLALFSSILITLNYTIRRKYFALTSIICVILLSMAFCFGISFALVQFRNMPLSLSTGVPLGERGLILSNSLNRNETAVVLLKGAAEPLGPRVIAIPDQPLLYQETAAADFDLPSLPFGDDNPWFLKSLSIDIRLNAEMLRQKFSEGYLPFLFYSGSLVFLMCALGFAIKFSVWPLANLFLCALAFRCILALESFLNTPEMQETIGSFLRNMIPVVSAVPLFFLGFGLLVNIYSGLVFAAKKRSDDGY